VGWQSENALQAQGRRGGPPAGQAPGAGRGANVPVAVKLSNNENPYGPSEAVKKAMADAFRYAHMYGTPDGGLGEALVKLHGVQREHILMGSGSGEILQLAGTAFVIDGQKVVGVDPTYGDVFSQATQFKADSIRIPLLKDYSQDLPAIIKAVKNNYRDVGFVYLCNPNNPTGMIVPKQEIRQLLDALPQDIPVLIDEAYHHFVEDPNYETAIPYVLEGRPVIVARTFSKIAGLAAMRLGYAIARPDLLAKMRKYQTGSLNVSVRMGAAAALQDTASQERVKRLNTELRNKATAELKTLGYESIPSEANFFMVHVKREVQGVIADFRAKGIAVGRPFPPMTQHLRVSVGTAEEMAKFMVAFKEIFTANKTSAAGANGR
jgi:histidinol-phosphate aminotransferase